MKKLLEILCSVLACSVLLLVCGCTEIPSSETESTTTPIVITTQRSTTTSTVKQTTKSTTTKRTTAKATTTKVTTKAPVVTTKKSAVVQTPGNGVTVYTTPKGKRYHYDPQCGGKNSGASSKDKAINAGLTPCQKCAQ